jgi:hypothetical protein
MIYADLAAGASVFVDAGPFQHRFNLRPGYLATLTNGLPNNVPGQPCSSGNTSAPWR